MKPTIATLADLMNAVARRSDTAGTKINTAEVRRVMSQQFEVLAESDMDELEAVALLLKGVRAAGRRIANRNKSR